MANKQIPALPPLDEAPADDDRFAMRDTSSGSDKSLRVDRFLERSGEQVSEHAAQEGGIHGIPEGERALHTADLGPAPDNVPDVSTLKNGIDAPRISGAPDIRQFIGKDIGVDAASQYSREESEFLLLCDFVNIGDHRSACSVDIVSGTLQPSGLNRGLMSLSLQFSGKSPSRLISNIINAGFVPDDFLSRLKIVSLTFNGTGFLALQVSDRENLDGRSDMLVTGAAYGISALQAAEQDDIFKWLRAEDVEDVSVIADESSAFCGSDVAGRNWIGRPGDSIGNNASLHISSGSLGDTVEVMIDGDGNVVEA